MSELSERERQIKKQKLAGPDPGSCQCQILDLPPEADELRKRGKLIWHWYDSSDDDDDNDPQGKVFIVDEPIYNAQMADSSTQVPDLSCRLCGKEGHANTTCTYQYYVPKGEQVGRGATLICRCYKKEGCHPGTNDWVGIAVLNYCKICGKRYAHRTEDCPQKQRMELFGDQVAFVGV